MGPEHFGDSGWSQETERMERNTKDTESERPSLAEVPQLAYSGYEAEKFSGWNAGDSERECIELPRLEEPDTIKDDKKLEIAEEPEVPGMAAGNKDAGGRPDTGEGQDAGNQYYSIYEERLKQTPREDSGRGKWSGERGESDFNPMDKEVRDILSRYDKDNITYAEAIPDFSEVAEATVEIENMTGDRAENFRQCDEKCVGQWNKEGRDGRTDWTARDVKEWRQGNGYSWHERNDMKTCDLIPTKVNDYFGHLGGVAECKKRDVENGGSDFDE